MRLSALTNLEGDKEVSLLELKLALSDLKKIRKILIYL